MLYFSSSLFTAALALVFSYLSACAGGAGYCGMGAMIIAAIAVPGALVTTLLCGLPVNRKDPQRGAVYFGIAVVSAIVSVSVATSILW